MDDDIDDRRKERENGEELAEAKLKRREGKPRTDEEVPPINNAQDDLGNDQLSIGHLEFDHREDAKTHEKHDEDEEVDVEFVE